MTERSKYNIWVILLIAGTFCAWGAAPWIDEISEPDPGAPAESRHADVYERVRCK